MKLRNKKTGIIGELHYEPDKEYHFTVATEDPADMAIYQTLAKLNEEWEDYKPRIGDVVLRNLIHDWAYINKIKKVLYITHPRRCCLVCQDSQLYIEFLGVIRTLEEGKTYTITELCGEKEE